MHSTVENGVESGWWGQRAPVSPLLMTAAKNRNSGERPIHGLSVMEKPLPLAVNMATQQPSRAPMTQHKSRGFVRSDETSEALKPTGGVASRFSGRVSLESLAALDKPVGRGPPHPGCGRQPVLQSCIAIYVSIACNNQTQPLPFPCNGPTRACPWPSLLLPVFNSIHSLLHSFFFLRVLRCARWSPPSQPPFPIHLLASISGVPRIPLDHFLPTVGSTCVICTVDVALSLLSRLNRRFWISLRAPENVK